MAIHVETHPVTGYHLAQIGVIMLASRANAATMSLETYLNDKEAQGWTLISACLAEKNRRIVLIFRS